MHLRWRALCLKCTSKTSPKRYDRLHDRWSCAGLSNDARVTLPQELTTFAKRNYPHMGQYVNFAKFLQDIAPVHQFTSILSPTSPRHFFCLALQGTPPEDSLVIQIQGLYDQVKGPGGVMSVRMLESKFKDPAHTVRAFRSRFCKQLLIL